MSKKRTNIVKTTMDQPWAPMKDWIKLSILVSKSVKFISS